MASQISNDSVFNFPLEGSETRKIWVNSKFLSSKSEYFADMYAFGVDKIEGSVDDAKDSAQSSTAKEVPISSHSVDIITHAHITYCAFLRHVLTGEPVFFKPLDSLGLGEDNGLSEERPCPKAIYRLAQSVPL